MQAIEELSAGFLTSPIFLLLTIATLCGFLSIFGNFITSCYILAGDSDYKNVLKEINVRGTSITCIIFDLIFGPSLCISWYLGKPSNNGQTVLIWRILCFVSIFVLLLLQMIQDGQTSPNSTYISTYLDVCLISGISGTEPICYTSVPKVHTAVECFFVFYVIFTVLSVIYWLDGLIFHRFSDETASLSPYSPASTNFKSEDSKTTPLQ